MRGFLDGRAVNRCWKWKDDSSVDCVVAGGLFATLLALSILVTQLPGVVIFLKQPLTGIILAPFIVVTTIVNAAVVVWMFRNTARHNDQLRSSFWGLFATTVLLFGAGVGSNLLIWTVLMLAEPEALTFLLYSHSEKVIRSAMGLVVLPLVYLLGIRFAVRRAGSDPFWVFKWMSSNVGWVRYWAVPR